MDDGESVSNANFAMELGDTHDLQERFDRHLRNLEIGLPAPSAAAVHAATSVSTGKSVGKNANAITVSVGDEEEFRVLSSLYSTTAYAEVTATAVCVDADAKLAVFLDNAASSTLTSSDITTLCAQYARALEIEYALLGEPSDINEDGVLKILMSKAVNELGASGGGIVTGFFFAGDYLNRTEYNPASNEQEVIFTLVPDPDGTWGTPISKSFAMQNLLTAVVPHEVQHLLNYYNRVWVYGGASENVAINEWMSHMIEDYVGHGQENPSRYELFLSATRSTALIPSSSPGLAERGAGYLFLRYLYEQANDGDAFLRNMIHSNVTGVTGILNAFGSSDTSLDTWDEMVMRWGVALAMTNAGLTEDSRYVYDDRTRNSDTNQYEGVCTRCSAEDGRATVLSGPALLSLGTGNLSIKASTGAFFDIPVSPYTLTLEASEDDELSAILIRTE